MEQFEYTQHVYIIGSQQLQNSLLAEFLGKEGITCTPLKQVQEVSEKELVKNEQSLLLVDARSIDLNDTISYLLDQDPHVDGEILVAIFNVNTDEDLARIAGLPMVNGGFLHDCPQDQLLKGVKSIFEGELWLPRKVLQEYLVRSRSFNKTFSRSEVSLTDREMEVLKVLATGAKNSEIARSLNLSPHTIKTHIYNIFKKINASNRLQAVNWAQENL